MLFKHRDQAKESAVFTLLGLLQVLTSALFLHDASRHGVQLSNPVVAFYFWFAKTFHHSLGITFIVVTLGVWIGLALGKRSPRLLFDVIGLWYIFKLGLEFLTVNALLFSDTINPRLLLGQILAYIPYFIVTWGWIFWRVDLVGRPEPQSVITLTDAMEPITSFDYYHASFTALVDKGNAPIRGITRLGRVLVSIYSLMLLDLIGLTIARLIDLVQKVI